MIRVVLFLLLLLTQTNQLDLTDGSSWKALPAEGVMLNISEDHGALRLDFDFQGNAGWAAVHRTLDLVLPANYEFRFRIRGDAAPNNLEFKLIDSSGQNVWWYNQRNFQFPADWKAVSIKKRHIEFAWGPSGGGELKHAAAMEFAITAGHGGKGTVWIDHLTYRELPREEPYDRKPSITASSFLAGHEPLFAMDGDLSTTWKSDPGSNAPQFLIIDFLQDREYGGLVIDWDQEDFASAYTVESSEDGSEWTAMREVRQGNGGRDYLFLPESESRYLRLRMMRSTSGNGYSIREMAVKPLEFSSSPNRLFEEIAANAPHGCFPRSFCKEMSYWTIVGTDEDTEKGLISEDGALEPFRGGFSIEPFVYARGRLITWSDVRSSQSLEKGYLPIPTVLWNHPDLSLEITGWASGPPDSSWMFARYRIRNNSTGDLDSKLFLAVRPLQVNPPWQFLKVQGGASTIKQLGFANGAVNLDGKAVIPVEPPENFGASTFDQGDISEYMRKGSLPPNREVSDVVGYASGALLYSFHLRPGLSAIVSLAIPLHGRAERKAISEKWVETEFAATAAGWKSKLNRAAIEGPESMMALIRTLQSNLAYVLINRDGPAIQPGSRSYSRSWIRDGSLISSALLRLGHAEAVRDFIRWYAKYQYPDGKVPCCVDERGADPVPENDSNGEFIFLIAEYYRFTQDKQLLKEMWPHVEKAVDYINELRSQRRTPEYRTPEKVRFFGLLPESISHEGYSSHPVHSYWDDFFALKGLKDATELAGVLGKQDERSRYAAARDEFQHDLYGSIRQTIEAHHIDYIPASADLADFDPASTTVAINPAGEIMNLPQQQLHRTFEKYYEQAMHRRDSSDWEAYTPYEWRTVGTLVRLGWKEGALRLADMFMADRRPAGWNQWAEVVWRDPRAAKFIGDMPHTWVGSDFIRSILDFFVFERASDQALVLAAGVPPAWLAGNGIKVNGIRTPYGALRYSLNRRDSEVEYRIKDLLTIPPGGIALSWPLEGTFKSASVNGKTTGAVNGKEVIIHSLPARVVMR